MNITIKVTGFPHCVRNPVLKTLHAKIKISQNKIFDSIKGVVKLTEHKYFKKAFILTVLLMCVIGMAFDSDFNEHSLLWRMFFGFLVGAFWLSVFMMHSCKWALNIFTSCFLLSLIFFMFSYQLTNMFFGGVIGALLSIIVRFAIKKDLLDFIG